MSIRHIPSFVTLQTALLPECLISVSSPLSISIHLLKLHAMTYPELVSS